MSSAPWTIGRLLQATAEYLKGHDAELPRLDAEVLLAEALGCRRIDLYARFDDVPPDAARAQLREWVRRRAEGMPVAYLVGHREFYSLEFRVDPAVLIPRPETELLVVALLDLAKCRTASGPLTIADVGTGSGILAVCAAKHLADCQVTAVDTSAAALAVAAANAARHGVEARIALVESDLLTAVPPAERFTFVVSNPPYVSTSEFERLPRDVKDFEPREALLAGPQGTEVIQRLIPQAAARLEFGGYLLLEVSPMIHDAVRDLLTADGQWQVGPTIKDLARHPRVVQAMRKH